jgi:hypothetical protein
MTGKRIGRDNALLVLFILALAWAFLLSGMALLGERVGTLAPAREGSGLHTVAEIWLPGLVAVVAAIALSALLAKLRPRFLTVPRRVSSFRLCVTLLVTAVIVGVAVLLVLIVVTMVLDPPGPHPENVQYISLVFWLPPLVAAVVTPAASVLIAWRWTIRQPLN